MTVAGTTTQGPFSGPTASERPCDGREACELGLGQCSGPKPKRRVHVFGTVFFDVVYSGLPVPPRPGSEVRATHLGISPGGVANVAVALARLGLDVGLSSIFAEDTFGQYLWSALQYEGIDLSLSVRFPRLDHTGHDLDRQRSRTQPRNLRSGAPSRRGRPSA